MRRLCHLLLVLALFVPGRTAATEYGAYWTGPVADPPIGVQWARGNPDDTGASPRRAAILWPGATWVVQPDDQGRSRQRLPSDPRQVHQAVLKSPVPGLPRMDAIEIGNEPDLHFSADTPDRLAMVQKAAWWALRRRAEAGIDRPTVLMPSMAALPGPYFHRWCDNEGARYTDAWNVHFYGWAHDFLPAIGAHRRFAARMGRPGIPLWITEYGVADTPLEPGPVHLARQRAAVERMTLEGTIAGVDQLWLFSLTSAVEPGVDFGLADPKGEPRPAMAAWNRIRERVATHRPVWRLHHRESGETTGWVLESVRDSSWWTVLFTPWRRADLMLPPARGLAPGAETSRETLRLRFGSGARPTSLGLDGEHPLPDGTAWDVLLDASTNLHLFTPPRRFHLAGVVWERVRPLRPKVGPSPLPKRPSPVIAALNPVGLDPVGSRLAYSYIPGFPMALRASLHELSGVPQKGTWRLTVPRGWAGAASGRVEMEADGDKELHVHVVPDGSSGPVPRRMQLEWRGDRGDYDKADIELRPAGAPLVDWERLDGQWISTEPGQKWEREGDLFRREGGSPTAYSQLMLPLPSGIHLSPESYFRVEVQAVEGSFRGRIELITPGRATFRHAEDWPIDEKARTITVRVGDFTPAFWSRAKGPGGSPSDSSDARMVRISVPGAGSEAQLRLRLMYGDGKR
jgi:hypothetical protein